MVLCYIKEFLQMFFKLIQLNNVDKVINLVIFTACLFLCLCRCTTKTADELRDVDGIW